MAIFYDGIDKYEPAYMEFCVQLMRTQFVDFGSYYVHSFPSQAGSMEIRNVEVFDTYGMNYTLDRCSNRLPSSQMEYSFDENTNELIIETEPNRVEVRYRVYPARFAQSRRPSGNITLTGTALSNMYGQAMNDEIDPGLDPILKFLSTLEAKKAPKDNRRSTEVPKEQPKREQKPKKPDKLADAKGRAACLILDWDDEDEEE